MPRRRLYPAALALLLGGCAAELPLARFPEPGAYQTARFGGDRRLVIRTADDWAREWDRIAVRTFDGQGRPLPRSAPPVDFRREMILLVESGIKPNLSYALRIAGVYNRGAYLEAVVHDISPGRCHAIQDVMSPTDIVRVRRSAKPVRWRVERKVQGC